MPHLSPSKDFLRYVGQLAENFSFFTADLEVLVDDFLDQFQHGNSFALRAMVVERVGAAIVRIAAAVFTVDHVTDVRLVVDLVEDSPQRSLFTCAQVDLNRPGSEQQSADDVLDLMMHGRNLVAMPLLCRHPSLLSTFYWRS